MGTDWGWNSERRPMAMTEDVAKMLVNQIIEGVTQARQSELLEHLQKFALVQVELNQARNDLQRAVEDGRKEIERRDAEIAALRLHIDRLMNMLTPASGNAQFSPYNNNGSAPVSSIPATFPVPMPPAPATYQTYGTVTEPAQ